MSHVLYCEFGADIRTLSINSLIRSRREAETLAYLSALKAWVEAATQRIDRLQEPCIIVLQCYYPNKAVSIDSDNNSLTMKGIVDGLKKYVLYKQDDGVDSVTEVRLQSRINGKHRINILILVKE